MNGEFSEISEELYSTLKNFFENGNLKPLSVVISPVNDDGLCYAEDSDRFSVTVFLPRDELCALCLKLDRAGIFPCFSLLSDENSIRLSYKTYSTFSGNYEKINREIEIFLKSRFPEAEITL